ncbi:MAG TPA: hypothetical protein VMZ50_07760, partial [Phycisphaerae bacterium]|nr:hypothetical protein [Phycisphaerae bacterium]
QNDEFIDAQVQIEIGYGSSYPPAEPGAVSIVLCGALVLLRRHTQREQHPGPGGIRNQAPMMERRATRSVAPCRRCPANSPAEGRHRFP